MWGLRTAWIVKYFNKVKRSRIIKRIFSKLSLDNFEYPLYLTIISLLLLHYLQTKFTLFLWIIFY